MHLAPSGSTNAVAPAAAAIADSDGELSSTGRTAGLFITVIHDRGRADSKPGHVRYAAESGNEFGALAAPSPDVCARWTGAIQAPTASGYTLMSPHPSDPENPVPDPAA